MQQDNILNSAQIQTPLGVMIAVGNDKALYLLEFIDTPKFDRKLQCLKEKTKAMIVEGTAKAIESITKELALYFAGKLQHFKTPVVLLGSPFQVQVWQELQKIPYGKTCSYASLSAAIAKPTAYRAVAQANGANVFPILIGCHRVVNANGDMGGYSGGLSRKKWLLTAEKQNCLSKN